MEKEQPEFSLESSSDGIGQVRPELARSGTRRGTCARLREGKAKWVLEVRPWSRSFSGTLGALQDKLEPIGNALELQEFPAICSQRVFLDSRPACPAESNLEKRSQSSARSCLAIRSARIG